MDPALKYLILTSGLCIGIAAAIVAGIEWRERRWWAKFRRDLDREMKRRDREGRDNG